MKIQLRENLFLGDAKAYKTLADLKANKITSIIIVANDLSAPDEDTSGIRVYKVGLLNGPNYTWVKDLACHIPKYLMQNGEVVLVQSVTGMRRGAFIVARIMCETENTSIYERFLEIQKLIPDLDLSKVYF